MSLVFKAFVPTGDAVLSLTLPDYMRENLRALQNTSISGHTLHASALVAPPPGNIALGDGLRGGLDKTGTSVVVWGFPGRYHREAFDDLLEGYELAEGDNSIIKLDLSVAYHLLCILLFSDHLFSRRKEFSMVSRFLIRLKSISEAHRFVRHIHGTHLRPDKFLDNYLLTAHVVY